MREKVKEKIERARSGERKEEKKKAMAAILVFMLTSLEIVFQRKNSRGELYFGCDVIQESS